MMSFPRKIMALFTFALLFAHPFAAQADYSAEVLADNPVAYWNFDETGADNATEIVSADAANALTLGNGVSRTAHGDYGLGNYLHFDAGHAGCTNTGLSIGQTSGSYAIEFWYRNTGGNYGYIVDFNHNSPAVYVNSPPDTIRLYNAPGGGSTGNGLTQTDAAQFHHVLLGVYVANGTVTATDAYIDGVQRGMDTVDFSRISVDMTQAMAVGLPVGFNDTFIGDLDELAVYDLGGVTQSEFNVKLADLALHFQAAGGSAQDPLLESEDTLYQRATPINGLTTEALTIRNIGGTQDLTLSDVQVAGADAAAFSVASYPAAIAPGQTGRIVVAFAPTEPRVWNAQLEISSNNVNGAVVTVALTGECFQKNPDSYRSIVLLDRPIRYWSFNEESGGAIEQVYGRPEDVLTPLGNAGRISATNVSGGRNFLISMADFTDFNQGYYRMNSTAAPVTASYIIEFWYRNAIRNDATGYIVDFTGGHTNRPGIVVDGQSAFPGAITLLGQPGAQGTEGTSTTPTADFSINDGALHHIVIGVQKNTGEAVQRVVATVDGAPRAVDTGTFNVNLYLDAAITVGNTNGYLGENMSQGFVGQIDELALYDLPDSLASVDFDNAVMTIAGHYAPITAARHWTLY